MQNINSSNKSIVLIKKRNNILFNSSDFSMPLATFTKYPIYLSALLNRIDKIKTHYSI